MVTSNNKKKRNSAQAKKTIKRSLSKRSVKSSSLKKATKKKALSKKKDGKTLAKGKKPSSKKSSSTSKKSSSAKTKTQKKDVSFLNQEKVLSTYDFKSGEVPINITVKQVKGQFVPFYEIQISAISKTTESILEKIRQELIKKVSLGLVDITNTKKSTFVEDKFKEYIALLVKKYFPDADDETNDFLISYLVKKSLGLGSIEILMDDALLEEIVINSSDEPVWVFHKKHGWLRTSVVLKDEEQTKHYAAIIGRKVGRQISVLEPLLDAHLNEGDRVNATLSPISSSGNTITIRKFSRDPWTITKFIRTRTISAKAAALVWLAMQYELSALIVGGTASGKTSALNVLANFFPPNQRIVSIEDTREIRLPSFLHWVPMSTRLPNAEGKGEIAMGDLLVNSLRMRPDRILVGEVRRRREAETLFEAIHTGHSVYATFHSNNAEEAIERLTNPPIDVPKIMLPAISLLIVQFRNRRTGTRRTFQIAEILPGSKANVLMQYDAKKDELVKVNSSKQLFKTLSLYTGMSLKEIMASLKEKEMVLNYLNKFDITSVDGVGKVIAEYYTDREHLLKYVKKNKPLPD